MKQKEFKEILPDGTTFHVREWSPDGTPKGMIFLLHGLADHGGRFTHVAESFSEAGFIFIGSDLRGNGLSSGKRGHFDSANQVMEDINYLIKKSRERWPELPLVVYGQSMGGNLALNYCIRYPYEATAVISSSPWLRLTNPPSPMVKLLGNLTGKVLPSLCIPNGLNADDLSRSKAVAKAYREDPLVHGKISLNTFQVITGLGEQALSQASKLSIPLLLMHGTSDNITSIQASRLFAGNTGKNCTFETWDGMRHELHNEPEQQLVLKFITDWTVKNV